MKYITLFAIVFTFFSCNKAVNEEASLFYGKWQASYNDTIEFFQSGNINILRYDKSQSPAVPGPIDEEYTYTINKLGIKNGNNGPDRFYYLKSFKWIEKGKKFEVQGTEWFPFISSTLTYFTFTKI
jgi:hypothetical protein